MSQQSKPCRSPFTALLSYSDPIPDDAKKLIEQHTYVFRVPGNIVLLPSGGIAKSIYFVHTGVLRLHKQFEHRNCSPALFFPGSIAPNPIDFFFEMPAQADLISVVPTTVCAIDLPNVRILFHYYPKVILSLQHLLVTSRQVFNERQEWEYWDTKDKILYFLSKYPDAPKYLTYKIIASYLGINEATLSRHRSAIYISAKNNSITKK